MATLHFICGKAASGKTTLARDLAERHGAVAFTVNDRAWVRAIFESAGADHALHVIAASDALCKMRLRRRNETKPEGLYYGYVGEELFDEVTKYFVPPSDEEGFEIIRYQASDG